MDENNTKTAPEKKPVNIKKEIISWIIIIAVAFGLALFITEVIIMKAEIISGSMKPGLQIDDHVIGNRLAYLFSEPERGDVIFFEFPLSDKCLYEIDPELTYDKRDGETGYSYHKESSVYVKRIIGLPGETVTIKSGKVYINDSSAPLDEPYLNEVPKNRNFGPFVVPEGKYFVLGDNRNHSEDARFWDNTVDDPSDPDYDPDRFRYVSMDAIYAKAVLKMPPDMHWVEHYDYNEE